jgi:hypothetical protein
MRTVRRTRKRLLDPLKRGQWEASPGSRYIVCSMYCIYMTLWRHEPLSMPPTPNPTTHGTHV